MGKVRDFIQSDEDALAQWVWRKIVNHDPMSHREGRSKAAIPANVPMLKNKAKDRSGVRSDDPSKVRYNLRDGRVFEITVRQVAEPDKTEEPVKLVQPAW